MLLPKKNRFNQRIQRRQYSIKEMKLWRYGCTVLGNIEAHFHCACTKSAILGASDQKSYHIVRSSDLDFL